MYLSSFFFCLCHGSTIATQLPSKVNFTVRILMNVILKPLAALRYTLYIPASSMICHRRVHCTSFVWKYHVTQHSVLHPYNRTGTSHWLLLYMYTVGKKLGFRASPVKVFMDLHEILAYTRMKTTSLHPFTTRVSAQNHPRPLLPPCQW